MPQTRVGPENRAALKPTKIPGPIYATPVRPGTLVECLAVEATTVALSGGLSVSGADILSRPRVLQPDDLVRLRPFAALNNVEFDFIAFLQTLVAIDLNRAVMHEDVCSAFTSEKAVAFRVVKPLHSSPVLRQCRALPCGGWPVKLYGRKYYDAQISLDVFWKSCLLNQIFLRKRRLIDVAVARS
jgi:hypothetical protein